MFVIYHIKQHRDDTISACKINRTSTTLEFARFRDNSIYKHNSATNTFYCGNIRSCLGLD
jgi:hypothetical protein